MEKIMIQEIEKRRSIRKYKPDAVSKEILEHIIYSATLAPSAKNRQPWKFIVYQGKEKEAYDAFYKAIWGGNFQAPGFYELACLDAKAGRFAEALEHVNESILRQYQ